MFGGEEEERKGEGKMSKKKETQGGRRYGARDWEPVWVP